MIPKRLVFGFTGVVALSCTGPDSSLLESSSDEPFASPKTTTVQQAVVSPPPGAPIAPAYSPRCPAGMREVEGSYCTAVLHWCLKGRTYEGQPTDAPDPYYCDEYKAGFARCLGKEDPKHFCMDEFEYPNQKGAIPMVMVSWYDAKNLCEQQGKRLCDDDEWTLACEGPKRQPYTYGWKRDASRCNIDKRWRKPDDGILSSSDRAQIAEELDRLSQRLPSGAMEGCVSPYGIMDMGGNVDEWAVNITLRGKPYQSIFKGGHWCGGARNRCRPVTESHDETTAYYAQGFRCCANPSK